MNDFLSGYKTYDPETEGHGSPSRWRRNFYTRMNREEAEEILDEEDPYTVLGVAKGCTTIEIKKAFRKLAMQWHPDIHDNKKLAESMMRKINAAYSLLI